MPKEKLTLTVDKEVVEKAKKLNLNISEITELALKGFTFSPKEADQEALYKSYQNLFDSIRPLLKKFGTSVKVADDWEIDPQTGIQYGDVETTLNSDGSFWLWVLEEVHEDFKDITKIPIGNFLSPKDILSDLIDSLAKAVERDKERLKELELAKRFVDAISATVGSRERPETKARGKKRPKSRLERTKT
jgi:hypothetical protein